MIKKLIGWVFYIASWPLIATGVLLFIINLMLYASSLAQKNATDFISPLVMIGVGYFFKVTNDKLRNVRY